MNQRPAVDAEGASRSFGSVRAVVDVSLQVTCGTGDGGCAGTIVATSGSTTLGTIPCKLKEEATATLAVPNTVPADAQDVTFTFTPTTGMAPPKPSTVPLQR